MWKTRRNLLIFSRKKINCELGISGLFFDRNECNVENIPEVEKNENLETISGDVSPCRK